MRGVELVAVLSGLLCLGLCGLAREARAGATVDLVFVAKNGAPIAATDSVGADPGDVLEMAVIMRNDEALTAAVFSLKYDLDGDDELDVVSARQWAGIALTKAGGDVFAPIGPLSPSTTTFVGSFNGFSSNVGLPRTLPPAGGAYAGGYQMGTVVWKVNAGVNADGADIVSGLLNFGIDVFGDATFQDISDQVLFRGATVNVPEPGTAGLLGLGLLVLVRASRRRRA